MRSKPMHSQPGYPAHANWSSVELADAIPLRLSERIGLGLVDFDSESCAANYPFGTAAAPRGARRGYRRVAALPDFIRVR